MAAIQVVRSEWTKIRSVQSTVWTLALRWWSYHGARGADQPGGVQPVRRMSRMDRLTFDPTAMSYSGVGLGQLA